MCIRDMVDALRADTAVAHFQSSPLRLRRDNGTRVLFRERYDQIDETDGDRTVLWEEFCLLLKAAPVQEEKQEEDMSLRHISEPTRPERRPYAVFCLKKKKKQKKKKKKEPRGQRGQARGMLS